MTMTAWALPAAVGLLVGLVAHTALLVRATRPLWLTGVTGVASALLGTAVSRLVTPASAEPGALPAALLAPLFFAGVGVAVLVWSGRGTSRPPR